MFSDLAQKEKIKEAILSFRPTVTISGSMPQALFAEVLEENPALVFYLAGYSLRSGFGGVVAEIRYQNTEVPVSAIASAKSGDDVENILHDAVRDFESVKVIGLPKGVNGAAKVSEFVTLYHGFYSNLVNCSLKGMSIGNAQCLCVTFLYRIGRVKLGMMASAVERKIRELCGVLFTPSMLPQTKAYIAHNFLARTVVYHKEEEPNPLERSYMQSAYGALINGKCVCQGYAEAYKRLLDAQGVCCEVLCGKIRGHAEGHAWNVVGFNGKDFYHVDVTWDCAGGRKTNDYYGKSDAQMSADRLWTRRADIVCAGTENILLTAKQQIARERTAYLAAGVDRRYLD